MSRLRRELYTIPNAITIGRIVLLAICVVLWFVGQQVAALALGFVAGVGDYLDGWLARRLGQSSDLGATLDQLSDLIFESCSILLAVYLGGFPFVVAPLYVIREWTVLSVRGLAVSRGWVIRSRFMGKLKTNFLHYAIWLIFIAMADVTPASVDAVLRPLALFGVYAGLLLSWASGTMYVAELVRLYDRRGDG